MIERRQIKHARLLELGKVLLLLVEREELLLGLPVTNELAKEILPVKEFSKAS
jgi:hypothetical protein